MDKVINGFTVGEKILNVVQLSEFIGSKLEWRIPKYFFYRSGKKYVLFSEFYLSMLSPDSVVKAIERGLIYRAIINTPVDKDKLDTNNKIHKDPFKTTLKYGQAPCENTLQKKRTDRIQKHKFTKYERI